MAGTGKPHEPAARATTEGRRFDWLRRRTLSGAICNASPNARTDRTTTRARKPPPSTVQSQPNK